MKKIIFTTAFALAVSLSANAQLKIWSGGKIYMGGTTTQPNSPLSVGGAGNSAFVTYVYQSTAGSSYVAFKAEAATGTSSAYNAYGVIGSVPSSVQNTYGVTGSSYSTTVQPQYGQALGVYGYAGNAGAANYAVYGRLAGTNNGAGVFGTTAAGASLSKKYAGYFLGEFETTDDSPQKPNGGSWAGGSDRRIKKDTTKFTDGLNVIRKIRPMNYKYNGTGGYPTTKSYIGVIAQEVNQVAPYCIEKSTIIINDNEKSNFTNDIIKTFKDTTGANKYIAEILCFNQDGLFWAMLNSIQEMDSTITELKNEIAILKGAGQKTGSNNSGNGKGESIYQIDLATANIILYDAEPNPFNNSTIIRYFVPETYPELVSGTAFIGFYDMYGKEIKKLEIKEKGFGKIEASTENLASGIYSYSIVINDKMVETKKMLKNK